MAMSTMMRSKIAQTTMILRLNMTRNTREDVIRSSRPFFFVLFSTVHSSF